MLKRVFNYTDFYGVNRTEEAYFYLNESELMELSLTPEGGFDTMVKRIIETNDGKMIIKTFRDIILKAYGKKSPDGRQFIKSEEISKEFSQTPMFNELLMEIVMNASKAAEFCTKIIPRSDSRIAANARKAMSNVDMKKKLAVSLPDNFYAPINTPEYVEETMGDIPSTIENEAKEEKQDNRSSESKASIQNLPSLETMEPLPYPPMHYSPGVPTDLSPM